MPRGTGAPNLTRGDARTRAELLEVSAYEVELDLTDGAGRPGERSFRSQTTVRFDSKQAGAATFIDLVAERIHAATLNGTPLDTSGYSPESGLPLPGLGERNTLVIDADCSYSNTGQGLHRSVDPADGFVYLHSQFETADAKRMYACFDQPDLKAPFSLTVKAPADWEVVSNGRKIARSIASSGAQVVRFNTTPPLPTYVTALVAGPFHIQTDRHDGIDLGVYCRASLARFLDADEILHFTKQGFDWLHKAFGYRYPFDKYDQLFVPEFGGAMENAGCVTVADDYVFRSKVTQAEYERRAETMLHELAHMWFGDLVTMRWWDDLWLNESFASYISVLCQTQATQWRSAWTTFANVEKAWAYRQDQLPSTHPIAADIPDIQAVEVNFDGITYAKGASVLKQLAAYVGVDAFLRAMGAYFRRHEFGNSTLADLLGALEEESGRDLAAWSAQWIETAGVNALHVEFTLDSHGRYTSFAIVQGLAEPGGGPARNHRLCIGRYEPRDGKLRRSGGIELDVSGERTNVADMIGVQQPDLLLLNDNDLTYAKIRLDERSMATIVQRIADIEDPLARTLCWSAAWEMTRDADLSSRDYVTLALRGVASENDIGVVQSVQARLRTALDRFVDPSWAPNGWSQLAALAVDAIRTATPGSDFQLAWARAFAAAARTDEHIRLLQGLLDGSESIPGLVVDAELRWSLLQALIALGAAHDAEIDLELERDRTTSGQRRAATARALRPTPEAKAEAWRLATADAELPHTIVEAIVAGFYHPAQHALTEPFVQPYFDSVRDIWMQRPVEVARVLVVRLYPDAISEAAVAATDTFLETSSLAPALRRLVSEGRAEVQRALRARERDAGVRG
jgi:aminopeptidase N